MMIRNTALNILVLNTIRNARITNILALSCQFYIFPAILTTRAIIIRNKNLYGYLISPSKIKCGPTQVFMQNGRRFLSDSNQIWIRSTNFYGSRHIKFRGNMSSGNRGDKRRRDGLKDGSINGKRKKERKRTEMVNVTGAFRDCANVPNKQ